MGPNRPKFTVPPGAVGVVLLAHGSRSGLRKSSLAKRLQSAANWLNDENRSTTMAKTSITAKKKAAAHTTVEVQAASTSGQGNPDGQPNALPQQVIRLRAFQKWEAAGRPAGDGVNFWLEAEHELLQAR
jgi:hypothetical protein